MQLKLQTLVISEDTALGKYFIEKSQKIKKLLTQQRKEIHTSMFPIKEKNP
jgi:hypothetical protein